MHINSRYKAVWLLVFIVILWSTGGVMVKLSSWNAVALNGGRSAMAALTIWMYLRRPHFTWSRPQIGGAVAYVVMQIGFVLSTRLTTAANAIFLQYTSPLFVMLFGFLLLREKPQRIDWAAIAAIAVGMGLFFGDELSSEGFLGNLVAILSGACMAMMVISLRSQKDGSPAETILLGNLLAAFVGIPFIFSETLTLMEAGIMLYLGVIQLGFTLIIYSILIKQLTAIEAVLIQTLEPILNPLWVFLIVAEMPGQWALVGGSVVLVAVTIRAIWAARQPSEEESVLEANAT
ncbi:MAG: DMT family transporter [Ardenticatenaceae bacterium]